MAMAIVWCGPTEMAGSWTVRLLVWPTGSAKVLSGPEWEWVVLEGASWCCLWSALLLTVFDYRISFCVG